MRCNFRNFVRIIVKGDDFILLRMVGYIFGVVILLLFWETLFLNYVKIEEYRVKGWRVIEFWRCCWNIWIYLFLKL